MSIVDKMDEIILVVPKDKLFGDKQIFQGVNTIDTNYYINNISSHFETMRRGDAEQKFDYKQPIPYVLLKRKDEVFLYKRLSGGGENRLFDKLSVGLGGHMNLTDSKNFDEILNENIERELEKEEMYIDSENRIYNIIGILNDDSDEVGQVHICILYTLQLDDDAIVEVKETEQLQGEWVNVSNLKEKDIYDKLENWSKIAIDNLIS